MDYKEHLVVMRGYRFKPQPQSDLVRPEKWNWEIVKYKEEEKS